MAIKIENVPANALRLFDLYADDAGNWSGSPLVEGNVSLLGAREDRGLLSHLKRAGLVTTERDSDRRDLTWLHFTKAGIELATERGFYLGLGERRPGEEDAHAGQDALLARLEAERRGSGGAS